MIMLIFDYLITSHFNLILCYFYIKNIILIFFLIKLYFYGILINFMNIVLDMFMYA